MVLCFYEARKPSLGRVAVSAFYGDRFPPPHTEIPRPCKGAGGFPLERKRDRSYFRVMRRAWRAVSKGPGGHSGTGRAAAGTALTGPGAPPLGVGFGVLYHAARQIAICCAHIVQIFFAVFLLPPSGPKIIRPRRTAPTKSPRRRRWRRCRTRSPAPPR